MKKNPDSIFEKPPASISGKDIIDKLSDQTGSVGIVAGGPQLPPLGIVHSFVAKVIKGIADVHRDITSIAGKFTPFKKVINNWDASIQGAAQRSLAAVKAIKAAVRDPATRAAISVYREAGGDIETLKRWETETKDPSLRLKYTMAMNLTDADNSVASDITNKYEELAARAQDMGVLKDVRDNYVNHLVQAEEKKLGNVGSRLASGKLSANFRFAKKRVFPTLFDAEQAGYKVVSADAGDLMGLYIAEMEKTINTRALVGALTKTMATDGRPLAVPSGSSNVIGEAAEKQAVLVDPRRSGQDYSDYRGLDHYALRKWKYAGKDTQGNPVMVNGDLMLHPDVYTHMKNVLGTSAIREWYNRPGGAAAALPKMLVKGLDQAQANVKQAMFSIPGFHYLQEGTHGIGHRVNPLSNIPEINFEKHPDQELAAQHGLRLTPDHNAMEDFREGLSTGPWMHKAPMAGPMLKAISEDLFARYIPGLKYKTYESIFRRNTDLYKKDVAAGRVTADDVMYLSAQQTNAAYGHLNMADMGRNPTFQHIFRMMVLAPDFLEARARFAAQASKVLIGGRNGVEQMVAIGTLFAAQYGLAAIINQALDGDPHLDEPMTVVYKNRRYGIRSVPGDVINLFKNTHQFIQGRISPVMGKTLEWLAWGKDYRGQKESTADFMKEVLTSWVPIPLRGTVPGVPQRNKDVNAWDAFLSGMGIMVSRYSPMTQMYDKVDKWKKSQGMPTQDATSYPPSKYRDLRNSVQDQNPQAVKREWDALLKSEKGDKIKAVRGLRESLVRPITGSDATDKKFRDSLNQNDKDIFDAAKQDRVRCFLNFVRMFKEENLGGPEMPADWMLAETKTRISPDLANREPTADEVKQLTDYGVTKKRRKKGFSIR